MDVNQTHRQHLDTAAEVLPVGVESWMEDAMDMEALKQASDIMQDHMDDLAAMGEDLMGFAWQYTCSVKSRIERRMREYMALSE